MNTLYKFIRRTCSEPGKSPIEFGKGFFDASCVEDGDEADENGFVLVNYDKKKCETLPGNLCSEKHERDTLGTSPCSSGRRPKDFSMFSNSSILDVPMTMQISRLSHTIQTCQVLSVNHRKFLDLDLFNYDFNVEMSVLNDQN